MTAGGGTGDSSASDAHAYNFILERLVDASRRDDAFIEGLVGYGLYKIAKREWIVDESRRLGRPPNADEMSAYVRTWTPSRLEQVRNEARQILADYAESAILSVSPAIREEALRGTLGRAIRDGVAANFVFSLLLIGLAAIVYFSNPDVLGMIERWSAAVPAAP